MIPIGGLILLLIGGLVYYRARRLSERLVPAGGPRHARTTEPLIVRITLYTRRASYSVSISLLNNIIAIYLYYRSFVVRIVSSAGQDDV